MQLNLLAVDVLTSESHCDSSPGPVVVRSTAASNLSNLADLKNEYPPSDRILPDPAIPPLPSSENLLQMLLSRVFPS